MLAGVAIALALGPAQAAPQNAPVLPSVIAADAPRYPVDAVKSASSGTVHLTVTTDGAAVTSARVIGSLTPFAEAALRNVKSWRFAPHTRTTFDVTFRYAIVERACDTLGRDTHAVATLRFPSAVDVFAEVDPVCSGASPPAPGFGIYVTNATVPFYPAAARASGIEGDVRIEVSAKGVLTTKEGPPELADPAIVAIRGWQLTPPPFAEEMQFRFTLIDADCRGGGPTITIGPGYTSYEIVATRPRACGPTPLRSTRY
jgi:hypothetical protein